MLSLSRHRRSATRKLVLSAALALVCAAPLVLTSRASAFAANVRVDLRVLVITDGSATVDAIVAQLDREGIPYDSLTASPAGRAKITAATLSDTVGTVARGKYQGVVVPTENSLAADEMTAVTDYEKRFAIRQVDAYTWAGPNVGETTAWSGTLDGTPLTVTAAAKAAGFGYLAGALSVDDRDPAVAESYGYLATPAAPAGATLTPLVTATKGATTGSLLAVYTHDGRDELVVTMAANRNQTHSELLAHGLVSWLTQGIHLGYWRNWFSVHVDDVFLPDDRWSTTGNCTVGDDCNPTRDPNATPYNQVIRMTAADVDNLVAWQRRQGIKLDVAFNGGGSDEAGAADPLTARVVANRAQFRFVNHTYDHPYLGCVQDFTTTPWKCATTNGQTQWVSQADITTAINRNVTWARSKGLPITASEVVTGEHSGLKSLPQMPTDNPNLAPALSASGIRVLASDASREAAPRTVGPARTVPRHPMNIYYNVAKTGEEIDEYNWIYTSRANGGSGICENNASSTCIAPLSATGFTGYIVPMEARIAFDHAVSADSDPHYAHQSNLTEDRILYPVLDSVLARYRTTFTPATPIVNPTYSDVAALQSRQAAWRTAVTAKTIEAYVQNGVVTVVNRGAAALDVPITAPTGTQNVSPAGTFGDAYGTERSTWRTLARTAQTSLRLPS